MKAAKRKGWQPVAPIPFLNQDPIAHLVGCSNEAPVVIDGQEITALINSGAQVLRISAQFCKELTLQIKSLGQLLELEGTGGAAIPYLEFVEVNLQILGIRNYNEDVLLLVIPTTTYSKTVPVMVGTKIISKALILMTVGELAKATTMWRQAHFGAVMLGSLQLSHSSSDQSKMTKRLQAPLKGRHCGGVEVLTQWCQRFGSHHTESHQSPHLALSMYRPTPVSRDTVCEYMSSQSWHLVPSCQQQWYPRQPMGNYSPVPPGYQSVCTTWAPVPWKYPLK